jgi:beta-lactamase regulating signal transducer with metallopeptidase domain
MSAILNWLSPEVLRPLGWALLHFLWQGTALAALLYVALVFCRRATTRYAVAMVTIVLMMTVPIVTFFLLRKSAPTGHWTDANSTPATALVQAAAAPQASSVIGESEPLSPDKLLWLVEAWIAGVAVFSLRTLGGFVLVERLRYRKASLADERLQRICLGLQQRVEIRRAIRFCQCNGLDVPAVVGWLRPAILLPMTALTGLSEAQLEAVIVHELAHIKRLDYFANLLQIVAETLLFYHPAVWWVSGRVRAERENCCDDVAIATCGNVVDYARALTFMEGGRTAPSLVMAANSSPFASRVMRLLGITESRAGLRTAGFVVSLLCLGIASVAGNRFLTAAHAAPPPEIAAPAASLASPAAPATSHASTPAARAIAKSPAIASVAPKVIRATPSPLVAQIALSPDVSVTPPAPQVYTLVRITQTAPVAPSASAAPTGPTAPVAPTTREVTAPPAPESPTGKASYIDGMKSVGLDNLTVDQLIAMKIQGVNPEYVRSIRASGLSPSVDDLIAMRIQGVTPEFVRAMRDDSINVSIENLVAMRVQGVNPAYVKGFHDLGLKPTSDDLIAMRIQGVSPEYVRGMRDLGLNPTIEQLVGMRIQGVTPEYVKALHSAGLTQLKIDDYISAKIMGITPEFVEKARSHGFRDLDLEKLIALKNAGVL